MLRATFMLAEQLEKLLHMFKIARDCHGHAEQMTIRVFLGHEPKRQAGGSGFFARLAGRGMTAKPFGSALPVSPH